MFDHELSQSVVISSVCRYLPGSMRLAEHPTTRAPNRAINFAICASKLSYRLTLQISAKRSF